MSTRRLIVLSTLSIMLVSTVAAQQAPAMHMHAAVQASPIDTRQPVQFPAAMQTNFLGNMRDHMQTINGIVQALAVGDYATASRTAAERLGLDSPSAAGCKPKAANAQATGVSALAMASTQQSHAAAPSSMDEMMALYIPETMRAIGLSMHTAASEFASVAADSARTHDSAAAMAALSKITQNCVACHSTYRLR